MEALLAKRARNRKWQQENREKFRGYNKRYRASHPATLLSLAARRKRDRLAYKTNPTRFRLANAKWRSLNPDKYRKSIRYWEIRNKDKLNELSKIRAVQNKDRIRAAKKKWQLNNKAWFNAYIKKRRALKNKQVHSEIDESKVLMIYSKCSAMTKLGIGKFSVDHIIPLNKGGWHHQDNLQILPHKINSSKNNNPFWEKWPYKSWRDVPRLLWPHSLVKSYETLLRYLGNPLSAA